PRFGASRVAYAFLVYMLSPLPRRSGWACSSLCSPSRISLPRKGCRVGLRIVLFEACSAFTRVTGCTLALSPIRDTLIEGFSHFVTSMTAPIASGWSDCRVGLAPTGKRRLVTAHTHYGHFIATVELFTGIFSMSLMTGLIFARFSRPNARLLFADNPVISSHDGKPTLMVRLANERHNIIGNATARLWLFKNMVSMEGESLRRFYELPLARNESPALALSWTLYHVVDEESPLYGLNADDLDASKVSLVVVVSGYDVVAAQTVHARKSYDHSDIRFGQRYADIIGPSEAGRIRIDYGRFHQTLEGKIIASV